MNDPMINECKEKMVSSIKQLHKKRKEKNCKRFNENYPTGFEEIDFDTIIMKKYSCILSINSN